MKFAREVLIGRVKDEIERRELDATKRTAEAAVEYDKTRAAYVNGTLDAWNTFANTIKRRCRAGQPVTTADVPVRLGGGGFNRTGQGYIQCWSESGPRISEPDVAALQTLLALLESTTTDEISTTELERMGFKMSCLFRVR
jgi:hypothetical protein